MGGFLHDVIYGVRSLRQQPGFTLLAVMTLALGIGANIAIFTVVNAVLLRPLPYANADRLVLIFLRPDNAPADVTVPFAPAAYLNLKAQTTALEDLAALSNKSWPANLTNSGEPERLKGFQVSGNFFSLLGTTAEVGRMLTPDDDQAGADRVVVISHDVWQRRFGGDRSVVNRRITLNGESYAVVGVVPAAFRFFTKTDVWTPLAFDTKEASERNSNYLVLTGLLKPGVPIEQATLDADRITRAVFDNPKSELHVQLTPPQKLLTTEARPWLFLLSAAVGFVLLIACVNIANLTLARGSVRHRELAVRSALGASRVRIVRLLLIESLLLALAGAGVGLLASNWAIQFLAGGLPEYLADQNAHVAALGIDRTAFAFTIALSLATTVLFGLVPALQLSRVDLNRELKGSGRAATGRSRLRSALVVTEVALALLTLIGSGLMIRSLWRLVHVNPGYDSAGVLTAEIDPAGQRYQEPEQLDAFYRTLLERVAAIPGSTHAERKNPRGAPTPAGWVKPRAAPPGKHPSVQMNQVSPDY